MNGHQEDEHSAHEEEEEEKREMEEEEEEAALAEQCKEEGDVAYRNGQYKNAVLSYSRALDADPTYLTAFCNRAAAQMMLGEYDRAIDDCQAALNVDNSFAKAHLRLAKAYRSKGNFADALISYTKAQIYDRDSQTAQTEKAETEELRDTWGAARKTFETRNFARSLTLLGRLEGKCDGFYEMKVLHLRALVENHQFEAAVEYGKAQLGKLQRLSQNHQHIAAISQLLSLLGQASLQEGDVERAEHYYAQMLPLDPDNREAQDAVRKTRRMLRFKAEGSEAFKRGDFGTALERWGQALQQDPSVSSFNAVVFCNIAAAHSKQGDNQEAVTAASEAIRLDPSYLKAYMRRAYALLQLGEKEDVERAIRDYQQAQSLTTTDSIRRDLDQKIREAQVTLKRVGRKDLYRTLGVARNASEKEIKKAYRKMALKWHPDRHSQGTDAQKEEAERRFREIGEAYDILTDPEKKRRYDLGAEVDEIENPGAGGGGGGPGMYSTGGIDPRVIFQMFAQQEGMGGFGGFGGGGGGGFGGGGFGGGGFPGGGGFSSSGFPGGFPGNAHFSSSSSPR